MCVHVPHAACCVLPHLAEACVIRSKVNWKAVHISHIIEIGALPFYCVSAFMCKMKPGACEMTAINQVFVDESLMASANEVGARPRTFSSQGKTAGLGVYDWNRTALVENKVGPTMV